jgi:hypothetical protein
MAIYNEILVGRFNRALQKHFGLKGGPPAPQLASEIAPTMNMFYGVENRYLEGWNRFGNSNIISAGGAGNRSGFRIRNPKGSNVIAVIEKWMVIEPTAVQDQPFVNFSILDPGTLAAASVIVVNTGLDNRGSPTPNMDLSASSNVGALLGVQILQAALAANSSFEFISFEDQELPLPPNSGYTLYANTLNQQLLYSILWRERVLEASETT